MANTRTTSVQRIPQLNGNHERGAKPSVTKTMHSASEHDNNGKCCALVRRSMKQNAKGKKGFEAARLDVFAIPGLS